jgi:hypothetical protein
VVTAVTAIGDEIISINFSGRQDVSIVRMRNFNGFSLRRRDRQGQGMSRPVSTEKQALKIEEEKVVVCRDCRHPITTVDALRSIDGSRTHTFFNPIGIVFEIICFSAAPGCAIHGPASTNFSWFSGFTWRLALCRNCLAHLGWYFESSDSFFFGLILQKLSGDI